jgi:Rrf2 family protein
MAAPSSTQFAVAVHVLTYLAGVDDGQPVGSPALAESVNANPVYVRRALTPLRAAGLVQSTPGARGGWTLGRPPESITLAEVWRLTRADVPILAVHGPDPHCATGRAVQRGLADIERELSGAVVDYLATRTVSDLLP